MRNYKEDFPIFQQYKDIAYIDNAATAQRPKKVIDAEAEFYRTANANPLRGLYELSVKATDCYESARDTVRDFINAEKSSEIIFTRNTTESINLVAYSYGLTKLKPGDEILITIAEHHSNMLPWQMVAEKTGAKLKYLECAEDGSYTDEQLREAITPATKLAAVAEVSNVLGVRNPVERIIELVHSQGGVVLVDGAQSTPHMKVDVRSLKADFFAFSGHKLMAPMGIGVLYGREELLNDMPPFLRGGEMIDSVTREGAVFAELPHKFEAGTVNAGAAAGLRAAIEYINEVGMDNIEKRERELSVYAYEALSKVPHIHIMGSKAGSEHCGIFSFTLDDVHPHDIASILDSEGVCIRAGHHCAMPLLTYMGVSSTARASLAFYNTEEDIDKLVSALKLVRPMMGFAD